MEKQICLLTAMLLGILSVSNLVAQNNQSSGTVDQTTITTPTVTGEIFRFKRGLVTHLLNGSLPTSSGVGFGSTDRWLSFGEVQAGSQNLYGFRTQFNGRGLVTGYSTAGNQNPFIQWGGNGTVSPGSLEFRSFTDPSGSSGNPPTPPIHRFSIRENGTSFFGLTPPAISIDNPWVEVVNDNVNGAIEATGIRSVTTNLFGNPDGVSRGVIGSAIAPPFDFNPPFSFTVGLGVGVLGQAQAGLAVGIWGTTLAGSDFETGVYGTTASGNGAAANFDGNTFCTSGFWSGSDKKLKKEIKKEENALGIVKQLNPVNYFFNKDANKWIKLDGNKQHGFISQEVEELLPELVKEAHNPVLSNGKIVRIEKYKALNYNGFIAILTKAIQELNNKVDSLGSLLNSKQTQTFVVKENNTAISEQILNETAYSLSQNVPNPFTSNTVIKYTVPATATNASIAVLNLNGTMLQQFNGLKGSGTITINGNTLQAGIYLYSLISNGQEIITKRMVLTK